MSTQPAGPVLVTGGGGMVGSTVVRALHQRGVEVVAHLGPEGVAVVQAPPGVRSGRAEITDLAALGALVRGCRAVVHAAGPPGVASSFDDPAGCMSAHVVGTATLLQAMRQHDCRRLVHISSAEVYAPSSTPLSETSALGPRSPYGIAKLAAESLVMVAARGGDLSLAVLRPFSVYGPGSPPGSVLGRICGAVAAGTAVLVADHRPVRDFVHVRDVARAVLAALILPQMSRGRGEPVLLNVCSGEGLSIGQLAHRAAAAARSPVPVPVPPPTRADRPESAMVVRLVGDPSRAAELLGWAPRESLDDGLAEMVAARRP